MPGVVDRVSAERLGETTRLGSYEIIRKLARGGMAELFLARGPRSADEVFVVKKILPRLAGSPRMTQLFLDGGPARLQPRSPQHRARLRGG